MTCTLLNQYINTLLCDVTQNLLCITLILYTKDFDMKPLSRLLNAGVRSFNLVNNSQLFNK